MVLVTNGKSEVSLIFILGLVKSTSYVVKQSKYTLEFSSIPGNTYETLRTGTPYPKDRQIFALAKVQIYLFSFEINQTTVRLLRDFFLDFALK